MHPFTGYEDGAQRLSQFLIYKKKMLTKFISQVVSDTWHIVNI